MGKLLENSVSSGTAEMATTSKLSFFIVKLVPNMIVTKTIIKGKRKN